MSPNELVTDEELIPPGAKEVLPPYGFVRLVDARASDLEVVNAARVSFARESDWEYDVEHGARLKETDEKVLRFLLKNRHGTPFEHTYFKFHVRAPIFVFREWHRHRIGISINEESARYVPLRDDFYVPTGEALRRQTDKPGRYKFEQITDEWLQDNTNPLDLAGLGVEIGDSITVDTIVAVYETQYREAYKAYESLMKVGVAKEAARAVLPVGIYSQMIWTCNARSLMAFLNLRNAETALHEIRLYAQAMEDIFHDHMPVTHNAFVENGRVAP